MTSPSPSPRFFDRWSATYDRVDLQRFTYRPIHDAVLERVSGMHPSTVVDLGCGTGQLTKRLVERFADALVVGVDLSPGMLAEAADRLSGRGGREYLVRADAEALPFVPSSVDLVVCTESFHWYLDQSRALDGLGEVIRPGGRLIIASIAMSTGPGDDLVRRVSAVGGRPIRALPPRRLRHLLSSSGFTVVRQRRIPRLGFIGWPVLTDARRRE